MSVKGFFSDEAKRKTTNSVARIESGSSAEIVVAMRHRVAPRGLAIAIAALLGGIVAFLYAWFGPTLYATYLMPIDAAVGALVGALVAWRSSVVGRWLTPRSLRNDATARAAREAFTRFGVERTSGRTGILVLASLEDDEVAIVADEGVPASVEAEHFEHAKAAMRRGISARSLPVFLEALETLAAPLAAALPRAADDVNELCDEPV